MDRLGCLSTIRTRTREIAEGDTIITIVLIPKDILQQIDTANLSDEERQQVDTFLTSPLIKEAITYIRTNIRTNLFSILVQLGLIKVLTNSIMVELPSVKVKEKSDV